MIYDLRRVLTPHLSMFQM